MLSGRQDPSLGLAGQPPEHPDVVLLDEPTNSLDLDGTGQLPQAPSAYEGAFVVGGQNGRSLTEISARRRLCPAGGPRETGGLDDV